MYNSLLKTGKIHLFLSDTGIKQDLTKNRKLKKSLESTLSVTEQLFAGRISSEIKVKNQIELSLTLCGNKKMQTLNYQHRGKDKTTDVLSFPMFDSMRGKGQQSLMNLLETVNLGDIVISKEMAQKQGKEFSITFEQEIIHLFTHGLLHLLGFDHEVSAKEERTMEELEQKIVQKVYKNLGLKGIVERHGRVH